MKKVKFNNYCPQYGKGKFIFLTDEEAVEFIRIKNPIIFKEKGYIYTYPYYCEYCDGWHLTSTSYHTVILEMMNHVPTIPVKLVSIDKSKEVILHLQIYEFEWKIADRIGNFATQLKILKKSDQLVLETEELINEHRKTIKRMASQMKGWIMTKILSDIPSEITFANEFQNLMYYYDNRFEYLDLKQCYIICLAILYYLEDSTLDIGDRDIYRREIENRLIGLRKKLENYINYFMELNDIRTDTETIQMT